MQLKTKELMKIYLLIVNLMFTSTGQQLTVFNKQSKILVGGKKDGSGRIIRPFKGTIAGKWSQG